MSLATVFATQCVVSVVSVWETKAAHQFCFIAALSCEESVKCSVIWIWEWLQVINDLVDEQESNRYFLHT